MYIKQVIIEGFKSFRDRTIVEPFDRRHNVVVGLNGAGKSNFFSAIQFVLNCDEYYRLRTEQRKALLHEGIGPRVVSAYVEIIFDNSDGRVPINLNEISIRRVIQSKSEQYFLNKKAVPCSEVMNMLESAGFSSSNPYYIVKQGKINQMATARDATRLKWFRELAGSKVYDERLKECTTMMREIAEKDVEIQALLQTIEERINTLETETEELKQYQRFDKTRRVLEFIIYEFELNDHKKKLANLEKQRNESGTEHEKAAANLSVAQSNVKVLTKKIKTTMKELANATEERDFLNNEQQNLLKEVTKVDLTIKDLTQEVMGDNKAQVRAANELTNLEKSIKEKQLQLEKIELNYETTREKNETCTKQLALKEQKRKELFAKEGRGTQFTSKEDRDRWIQSELKSLGKQIKDKKEHCDKLRSDLEKDNTKSIELSSEIEKQSEELNKQQKCISDCKEQRYSLEKNKNELQATRNELWRKENIVQRGLTLLKEDLAKAEQKLRSTVGKAVLNGRDSVEKVLQTFNNRGGPEAEIARLYYGQIIENIECEKSMYSAVEVTAGNRLFHHVVDSDKICTAILKEMNEQRLPGVVTFMPLNRLNVRDINYTTDPAVAFPLVSKLRYDRKYDAAMHYIFGKTLVCRNLEVATQLAKSTKLDCVTLDGDQVSSKGSLTGGYFNASRSRLELHTNRSETIQQIRQCEDDLKTLKHELQITEFNMNNINSELQKIETKNIKDKAVYDKVTSELRLTRDQLANIDRLRVTKKKSLAQCKSNLETMQTTKESLESELQQELLSQLCEADRAQVDSLNLEIRKLQEEHKEAFNACMELEAEKSKLNNLLANNLIKHKLAAECEKKLFEVRKKKLQDSKAYLEEIVGKIDKVDNDLTDAESKVNEIAKRIKTGQIELVNWKKIEKEAQDKINEDAKHLEKFASKQNLLEQKIADYVEKIERLGTLPGQDLYSHYVKMPPHSLFKELERTNNKLRKFSHVNKKALEQFTSFSEQKEKMKKRKLDLDRGNEQIKELLSVLEQRKTHCVQFTYKQVSRYFTEVFKKLVPTGRAKLVMIEGQEVEPADKSFDNFVGIGIKTSFSEAESEMKDMHQLSGGQKSLVALALIFAIQQCDPAPFYLFDEVDEALDKQSRMAVADLIHELSGKAQFVTITFRPELLRYANQFYGVQFKNKASHIDCITQDSAMDLFQDRQTSG